MSDLSMERYCFSVFLSPLSLYLCLEVGTKGRARRTMANVANLARDAENVTSVRVSLNEVDPAAAVRNGWNEDNGAVAVTISSTAVLLKGCDTRMDENLSPSSAGMQENKAPTTKTPLSGGPALLKRSLPFRERNSEEGKKLLLHIQVPPKKLFGYPERYKSPTDAMVSPVSRGLLTRNRRPARTLAPMVPPKALENTFQDVVVDTVGRESESNQLQALSLL